MVATFPPEVTAGVTDPTEAEAFNLYAQFSWLARLADEMHIATDLDLKKVMQLVLHARKYRFWYAALLARGVPARDVIEGAFIFKRVLWANRAAMLADLLAIHNACEVIADWVEANAVEYKQGFTTGTVVGMDAESNSPIISDTSIKMVKSAAIGTRLANLRALWGPKI